MFDAHANLALATVAVAPSPALSGTSLIITAGFASLFPATPFNATVFPANASPTAANAEIVRVTNITGDIFTIVRAQEGTTAKAIASGYRIGNTVTAKVFTDIETAINSVSSQAIMSISAGASNATGNQVVFSNSNNVSFGASNGTITAIASFAGGGGGAAISAGANSQSTGTVVFSNSNGVTFGLSNNGVLTASHNGVTNALTSQSNQAASASNGSFAFQTLGFSNANNVTFGTSAGGIITASVATAAAGNSVNFSAGTTSNNLGSIVFSNSGGVSFGLNGSTLTASVAAGGAAGSISAGTTNVALGEVVFSNSNGVSFGLNGSTVTAAHNGLTSQSNQAFSAQGGSSAFQTLEFANSNGITFSNSGGSVVASHNGLTSQSNQAASASNGSFTFQTIGFSNANNVTFGTSAGSIITASVAAGGGGSINFSAGTTSNNLASVVFSNSNGVTFGLDNGTITASAAGGTAAGGATYQKFAPWLLVSTIGSAPQNGVMALAEFSIPAFMSAGFGRALISYASTASNLASSAVGAATVSFGGSNTYSFGLYTFGTGASSNSISQASSGSVAWAWSNGLTVTNSTQYTANMGLTYPFHGGGGASTSSNQLVTSASVYSFPVSVFSDYAGFKFVDVPLAATITPGNYLAAFASSSSSQSGSTGANITAIQNPKLSGVSIYFIVGPSGVNSLMGHTSGSAFALSAGNYTTFANSLNRTDIEANANNRLLYFQIGA